MSDLRPHLLFLAHRIPYPPDKGDKIRSYRWLRALSDHFQVHLGAFIDDPADWVHVETLAQRCASTLFLPLPRQRSTLRSLTGFFTGEPLSFPYYRDARMRRWAEQCLGRYEIGHVFVYSSAMAQYVAAPRSGSARRVIDFVDVDSDKWRQYAQSKGWPLRWIYRREAERLACAERDIASEFAVSVFVSIEEASHFERQWPVLSRRLAHVSNGVDTKYFDPGLVSATPFPPGRAAIVFTGAMDYWANVDAVLWFATEIWPRIRSERPDAMLVVVGSNPSAEILGLAADGVVVTGRVPDVRPYLKHAAVVIAPLRMARGIQNKVLEGMAMARPVAVTSKGLEGIDATPGRDLLVADAADAFSSLVLAALAGGFSDCGVNARRLVLERYDWNVACESLVHLVRGDPVP